MIVNFVGEITAESAAKFLNTPLPLVSGGNTLVISSPGGDIGYMLAMFDAIKIAQMNTVCTGTVQSAAAVLSQAGAKRLATSNALFRFVKPDVEQGTGEINDLRWYLHSLCVNLLAQRLGVEVIEGYDIFDNCFMNAQRALELNIIDKIVEE